MAQYQRKCYVIFGSGILIICVSYILFWTDMNATVGNNWKMLKISNCEDDVTSMRNKAIERCSELTKVTSNNASEDTAHAKPSISANDDEVFETTNITSKGSDKKEFHVCFEASPLLTGHIDLFVGNNSHRDNWPPTLDEIADAYYDLEPGGYYPGPTNCTTKYKLSIIIPFRDREEHLRYFLHYIHGILQRQQVSYTIYVVEQDDKETFNKGQLMNIGFQYAMNQTTGNDVNCVFFHDVDLISEDDRTLYRCGDQHHIVHLAHRIDKFNYRFCCGITVGGVIGFIPSQFTIINGFSNLFQGWGGEDDDINQRILKVGKFKIFRPKQDYARFTMIKHVKDVRNTNNPLRFFLLQHWRTRQPNDGLNSLQAQITKIIKHKTHSRLFVKVKSNLHNEIKSNKKNGS